MNYLENLNFLFSPLPKKTIRALSVCYQLKIVFLYTEKHIINFRSPPNEKIK